MRYSSYQPSPYRGRRSRKPLLMAAVVLAAVLGISWYFLSDYMIFSADGFEFGSTLERPQEERPPQNYGEPNFVIEDKTPPQPEPEPPAEPEPETQEPVYKLYPADINRAAEEGYLADCIEKAREGDYEAIALTVRTEEGVLYLPCANRYGEGAAHESAAAVAEAVKAASADFPFAAVMPVCRDDRAPRVFRDQSLKTGGVTWLDQGYFSWMDAYLPGAAEYGAALLETCHDNGFSAVVLTRMCFPGKGKLDLIDSWDRQTAGKQEAITALGAALHEKASALGLQLSLVLENDQAENVLVTGQSVTDLQQYFSCIYLPEGDPAPLADRYENCRFGTFRAEDGYLPYAPVQ